MTASTQHPLAAEWLERLRTASAALPASEQADLLADIEAHLAESIPADATEAEVRDALDRMGDPEEIVAEAQGSPLPVAPRRGTLEWPCAALRHRDPSVSGTAEVRDELCQGCHAIFEIAASSGSYPG